MNRLALPEPFSAGIFLSYRCTNTCKHCMYACCPAWPADWIGEKDAVVVLAQLAAKMRGKYPVPGRIGVNDGIHFTGGEPFLNFDLLLRLTEAARGLELPATFVETNGFWCKDEETARGKMEALHAAGLDGIFVSANPFILEQIPFECTERAVRLGREIFGANTIIYQRFFYEQFRDLGLRGTLAFEEYLDRAGYGLQYVELFANGRVPYKLGPLFQALPASRFFGLSCRSELIRDWHIHVDNYCNLVPGFCGGLSLGDARALDALCEGIDLDELPVLKALLTNLAELYHLGRDLGYQEAEGYISKCHLCVDIRRHLARYGDFRELCPEEFYERLEEG